MSRFSVHQNRAALAPAPYAESARAPSPAVVIPNARAVAAAPKPDAGSAKPANRVLDARMRIHRMLLDEINLVALERLPRDEMRGQVFDFVSEKVHAERMAINSAELDALVDDIVDEMVGLGPLEPLMKDPEINDILINGHQNCFVERKGKLQQVQIPFKDEAHLLRIINKIVAAVGRRVDESAPMVDARMLDGSRFNAAIRPVGVDGPLVSIRKFSKNKLGLHRLVEFGALTQNMAEVLAAAVHARKTTIISGGTGTGKTTMLNALSAFIPEDERLITIEDAAELQLQQPHVARMETRPANIEGHGELKQRDLVKNALRMRPDRVILGECRGEEAFDMLQAMNTGHEGSMATIHANTPRDAIARLEQMLGMTGMPMTVQSIRSQISSALDLIVQLTRLADGKRKVTSVAEVTGMEGDVIQMQEIFRFVRTGMESDGKILGHYEATGIRPRFLDDLKAMGIEFPGKYFEPGRPQE
ncbi:MAG: CpaF family protein [Rhizobiaceae bacterium]